MNRASKLAFVGLAAGAFAGVAAAEEPLFTPMMEGGVTYLEIGQYGDPGPGLDGCSEIENTLAGGYNTGTGWTVSSGAVGQWGPANPFTPNADVELCEIQFVGSHVTGANTYEIWLMDDGGGCPGSNIIATWPISNLGQFGGAVDPQVLDATGICLEGGTTYWIGMLAIDASSWGVANWSNSTSLDRCNYDYAGNWSSFGFTAAQAYSITATDGCGALGLDVSGSCPGRMTGSVTGATPGGNVAFVYAFGTGSQVIPSGPCAGTQLGLNNTATLLGTATADGSGNASLSGNAPASACGRVFLQAVDATSCATSNVVGI